MVGKKLINQSLIYGLASLLINGSNFFLIPFYTHYLTTVEYGIVSGVTVFSTMTTAFLAFGLNGAATRFYFDLDKTQFEKFLFTIFSFQVLMLAAVAAVFFSFDGLFLDNIYRSVPYEPYMKYGFATGLLGVFATIPLAVLQARAKAVHYRIFTTSSFILITAFMFLFVVGLGKGSIGGVLASLLAASIMAVAYTVFVLVQSKFSFDFSYLKGALVFGLPLMVYTVFGTLTELSSRFFVERYISLSELGIFNVAQQISSVMVLITNAINMAWTPIFYEEVKRLETSPAFESFGKFLVFLLTFLGLGLSLFVPELVDLLVSKEYQDVALYVPILVLTYIIGNGYWILIINPLTYARKTGYLPLLTILSGIVAVGLSILLVNQWGVPGAALAMTGSYLVLISTSYVVMKRTFNVRYDFRKMNSMLLIGVLLYIASTFAIIDNLWLSIAFKTAILVLFYFILAALKIYSIADVRNFISSKVKL